MVEMAAAGIPPHLFWDYTWREITAVLKGAAVNARRSYQVATFTAYHVEHFNRTKRLPKLSDLLRKLEPAKTMSREALRSTVLSIAQALGATVVRRKKPKE